MSRGGVPRGTLFFKINMLIAVTADMLLSAASGGVHHSVGWRSTFVKVLPADMMASWSSLSRCLSHHSVTGIQIAPASLGVCPALMEPDGLMFSQRLIPSSFFA